MYTNSFRKGVLPPSSGKYIYLGLLVGFANIGARKVIFYLLVSIKFYMLFPHLLSDLGGVEIRYRMSEQTVVNHKWFRYMEFHACLMDITEFTFTHVL